MINDQRRFYESDPATALSLKQAVENINFAAEYCILATLCGAADLDLDVFLLRDCIASGIPENIRLVERINEMLSLGVLKKVL